MAFPGRPALNRPYPIGDVLTAMAEDPRSNRRDGRRIKQHGTSRGYILERLRRAGQTDLAIAVESGRVSAYAIACELGWITRHPTLGTGSTNQAKRRRYRLDTLLGSGRPDV